MKKDDVARTYIAHLSNGELDKLLKLFSKDAVVNSPVYGTRDYMDFYTQLFSDTKNSELKILGIFEDSETGNIALHFDYSWTLKDGAQVNFEVVDILEFDQDHKIKVLTIIYDTVKSRQLVNQL